MVLALDSDSESDEEDYESDEESVDDESELESDEDVAEELDEPEDVDEFDFDLGRFELVFVVTNRALSLRRTTDATYFFNLRFFRQIRIVCS